MKENNYFSDLLFLTDQWQISDSVAPPPANDSTVDGRTSLVSLLKGSLSSEHQEPSPCSAGFQGRSKPVFPAPPWQEVKTRWGGFFLDGNLSCSRFGQQDTRQLGCTTLEDPWTDAFRVCSLPLLRPTSCLLWEGCHPCSGWRWGVVILGAKKEKQGLTRCLRGWRTFGPTCIYVGGGGCAEPIESHIQLADWSLMLKPRNPLHTHQHNPWCCYASLFSSLSEEVLALPQSHLFISPKSQDPKALLDSGDTSGHWWSRAYWWGNSQQATLTEVCQCSLWCHQ